MIAWRLHFTAPNLRDPFREIASLSGFGRFTHIVGYNETTYQKKYSLVVPEFDAVGSTGLSIASIKPVGLDLDEYGAGDMTIQTFTDMATGAELFCYLSAEEADDETEGWHEFASGEMATKTFAKGEGFMVYMPAEGISLNVSGEVTTKEVVVPCRKKYTLMGNIRPMTISIHDLIPVGLDLEAYGAGDMTIQTFTDMATGDELFCYLSAEEADDEAEGWHEFASGEMATKTFKPAEGFMIYMPAEGISLKYKAVAL